MCDLIVQISEDLHKPSKEKKMMDSCDSDMRLILKFPLKENYLQVVQNWAPHQNLKMPQEDLQVTLSSVAAEVCC